MVLGCSVWLKGHSEWKVKRNEKCTEKQCYEAQELMQFFFGSFVAVSLTELIKLSMLRRESLGNLPNLGGWQPRQGEVLIEQHLNWILEMPTTKQPGFWDCPFCNSDRCFILVCIGLTKMSKYMGLHDRQPVNPCAWNQLFGVEGLGANVFNLWKFSVAKIQDMQLMVWHGSTKSHVLSGCMWALFHLAALWQTHEGAAKIAKKGQS